MVYLDTIRIRCYNELVDIMSGDRIQALEAWYRIFPRTNPQVLREDAEVINAVYNK